MKAPNYSLRDGRKVSGVGKFVCAFCAGWYDLVSDGSGAVHSEPPCEVFTLLEVDQFATASRMAWQQLRQMLPPVLPEATA